MTRPDPAQPSLYEAIGGEPVLRAIIHDFVTRMVNDIMIGFFFRGVDPARLEELELQFTARFLGAPIGYQGRAIREAHQRHPIMGGQFDRRKQLLREAIERHGVAPEIRDAWLLHVESMRSLVTRDAAGECDPEAARGPPAEE